VITTDRLVLRQWRDADLEPFAAMGQDPRVMEFFPALLSRDKSDAVAARIRDHIAREGFGFWAVEVPGVDPFIGFCGIARPTFTAPFTPCVEIGWRLAHHAWGHGYAIEAARAALGVAFGQHAIDEIVAFLLAGNARSARVCERLGMTRDHAGDFDHPLIEPGAISVGGHPQQRHALYRIRRVSGGQKARVAKAGPPGN